MSKLNILMSFNEFSEIKKELKRNTVIYIISIELFLLFCIIILEGKSCA